MFRPDVCVYHGNCADGFTAAWLVSKHYPDIEFFGAQHGTPVPPEVVKNKHVLMVDFAPKLRQMEFWQTVPASLVIIDHHKSALEDLAAIHRFTGGPDAAEAALNHTTRNGRAAIVAMFDMEFSGAGLTWRYLEGVNEEPGALVKYVEDRDLWRWQYGEESKRFAAAIGTMEQTFVNWDLINSDVPYFIQIGGPILKAEKLVIEGLAKEAYDFQFDVFPLGGGDCQTFTVPVVNAPYVYASELANLLLKLHPEAPFAACWFRRGDGKVQWSLRSDYDREDVSAIARRLGGGGHRNAAGFECTPDDMDEDWIDTAITEYGIAEKESAHAGD